MGHAGDVGDDEQLGTHFSSVQGSLLKGFACWCYVSTPPQITGGLGTTHGSESSRRTCSGSSSSGKDRSVRSVATLRAGVWCILRRTHCAGGHYGWVKTDHDFEHEAAGTSGIGPLLFPCPFALVPLCPCALAFSTCYEVSNESFFDAVVLLKMPR